MKSITQIDQEQDTKSLISLFLKLIGLKELSHQINFKRKSKFNLVWLFSYLLELLAWVYDHNKGKTLAGYRGLTLGWSDGNTFLPVNFALMPTKSNDNLIGKIKTWDQRSLAGKRRAKPAGR